MKKLTIVTVCYNSAKHIEKCINSIISQLNKDVEYLIIDGKSTDGTIDIIEKYIKKDKNIRYISEKDSGIYNAMNKALKLANGQWILYINSDDFLEHNVLNDILPHLTSEFDCIYGDNYNILKYENIIYSKKIEAIQDLEKLNKGMIACHQSVILKKEVMEKLNGFNENYKISADWDLLLRVRNNGYKFKYIPIVISNFSVDGVSSNTNYMYETHSVRKQNKCYKIFDIYFVLEFMHNLHLRMKLYNLLYGKKAFYKWLEKNNYKKIGGK